MCLFSSSSLSPLFYSRDGNREPLPKQTYHFFLSMVTCFSDSCALQNYDVKVMSLHCWKLASRRTHGGAKEKVQSFVGFHYETWLMLIVMSMKLLSQVRVETTHFNSRNVVYLNSPLLPIWAICLLLQKCFCNICTTQAGLTDFFFNQGNLNKCKYSTNIFSFHPF